MDLIITVPDEFNDAKDYWETKFGLVFEEWVSGLAEGKLREINREMAVDTFLEGKSDADIAATVPWSDKIAAISVPLEPIKEPGTELPEEPLVP